MYKKIILVVAILIVLLVASAAIIPFFFKDKIKSMVLEEANKSLTATLAFSEVDISLFRSFPNVSVKLEDLSLVGQEAFEGDTLIYSKSFELVADIMSVLRGGEISLRSLRLDQPVIRILTLEDGSVNYDIMKPDSLMDESDSDSSSSNMVFNLRKYEITEGDIIYDDLDLKFFMHLQGVNHKGSGNFTTEIFTLETFTTIASADMDYEGVRYLSKAKVDMEIPLDMDLEKYLFVIGENEKISINELQLGFDGSIELKDDGSYVMDYKFDAAKSDFKKFLSLVPVVYTPYFEKMTASGNFGFNGFVRGVYSDSPEQYPSFGVDLVVENGSFRYPDLPTGVNNININLRINNPVGTPDQTVVDLSKFSMSMGDEPFEGTFFLRTPISDPDFRFSALGTLNLGRVSNILPLEDGTKIAGEIKANIMAAGRMSTLTNKQYDKFNAKGNLGITDLVYQAKDLDQSIQVYRLDMELSPQKIALKNADSQIGKSNFKLDGSLENFFAYAFDDGVLQGNLNLRSTLIDANEFLTEEEGTTASKDTSTPMTIFEVPKNINFTFRSSIDRLLYDNLVIDNVEGSIVVKDETMSLNQVAMTLLEGRVTMNGFYKTVDPKKPAFDFALDVAGLSISKVYNSFSTIQEMAPICKHLSGNFNANLKVLGTFLEDMTPDLKTLSGFGSVLVNNSVLADFAPVNKLADALKMPQYKQLKINDTKVKFAIRDGRVHVEPFTYKFNNLSMVVVGSNGLDQSIDYDLDLMLPRSEFGNAANQVLTGLQSKLNNAGGNLELSETVSLKAKITGSATDPKVKLDLKETAKGMTGDIKDDVKDVLDQKKKEAEDRARMEAERLRQEAEQKAKDAVNNAKSQAEQQAKEAAAKAKAEAEQKAAEERKRLEEKAKEELRKKLPIKK